MKTSVATCLMLFSIIAFSSFAQKPGSGFALDLNGSGDYVEIPNTSALNPTTAFTVEAWINADTWAANSWLNTIVSKDTWSSISEGWVLRCGANGTLSFNLALNSTNVWYEVTSSPIMLTNKWYHVAGTYDGTTLTIYINGVQSGTLTQVGSITPTLEPVKIGNIARPATSRFFDGKIDEVRLWSKTLTETEIRTFMCKKVTASHPQYASLIAYWNMDTGSGTSVSDVSGNGNSGTSYGPLWVTSGAAIGNESRYLYTSTWAGKSVALGHANGDSIFVSGVTGNPSGIQLYRVDTLPNSVKAPAGVAGFYDKRYWGIFPTSGTNVNSQLVYDYTGYPGITNQGVLNISRRTNNADTIWLGIQTTLDSIPQTLTRSSAGAGEYIMGRNDNLTDFVLTSPASSSSYTLQGLASQTITFDWKSSRLSGSGNVTYDWMIDHDTANFTTPLKNKISAVSGTDSTVDLTYLELASMMTLNGIFYDETLDAQWTVQASGGPVKKQAAVPFDISLKRGILSTDQIYAFFIIEPDEDTLKVYNGGSQQIDFNWFRAKSSAGNDMTYEVQFTGFSGFFTSPLGTFPANNGGKDSVASISHAELATMLQNVPIANGAVFRFKWRTVARIGTLEKASADSQYVWIVREDDPFAGVNDVRAGKELELYPVPAGDKLWIRSATLNGNTADLRVFDYTGKAVRIERMQMQRETAIDLSGLQEGVYFLDINADGIHKREKFVITR